eukprot:PhM_4_TR16804/c0_g1_i1/m.52075
MLFNQFAPLFQDFMTRSIFDMMNILFDLTHRFWCIVRIPPSEDGKRDEPIQYIRKFMLTLAFLLAIPVFVMSALAAEVRWGACTQSYERGVFLFSFTLWTLPMTALWLRSRSNKHVSDLSFNIWASSLTVTSLFNVLLWPYVSHQLFILFIVLAAVSGHGNSYLSVCLSIAPFALNTYNLIVTREDSLVPGWMDCEVSREDRVGNQLNVWACALFMLMLHRYLHMQWQERIHAALSTENLLLQIANDLVVFDTEQASLRLEQPNSSVDPVLYDILSQLVHDMALFRPFLPGYLTADIRENRQHRRSILNGATGATTSSSADDDDRASTPRRESLNTVGGVHSIVPQMTQTNTTSTPTGKSISPTSPAGGLSRHASHSSAATMRTPLSAMTNAQQQGPDNVSVFEPPSTTTRTSSPLIAVPTLITRNSLDSSSDSTGRRPSSPALVSTRQTSTPEVLTAANLAALRRRICLGAVALAPQSKRLVDAGVQSFSQALTSLVDSIHTIADTSHATLHGVVADTVHASWNTARKLVHPEPNAALFILRVQESTGCVGAVCSGEGHFHFVGRRNVIPLVHATSCSRDLDALFRHYSVPLGLCVCDHGTAQLSSAVCMSHMFAAFRPSNTAPHATLSQSSASSTETSSGRGVVRVAELVRELGDEPSEEWMYELARREQILALKDTSADIEAAVELCLDGRAHEAVDLIRNRNGGVATGAMEYLYNTALRIVSGQQKAFVTDVPTS